MALHHSIIIPFATDSDNFIKDFLKRELSFEISQNPDFLILLVEIFGIDEARDFKIWTWGKPLIGSVKVALIRTKNITYDAQNALLKTLEEPPEGTYIFIQIENLAGLLPTFLSRVRVMEIDKSKGHFLVDENAQKFLKDKIRARLILVKNLADIENKDRIKEMISSLERVFVEEGKLAGNIDWNKAKKILKAKVFAGTRGSSPKIILEWLSSVL